MLHPLAQPEIGSDQIFVELEQLGPGCIEAFSNLRPDRRPAELSSRLVPVTPSDQDEARAGVRPERDRVDLTIDPHRVRKLVDDLGTQAAHAIHRNGNAVQVDIPVFGFQRVGA
jgi:hypothetical protein